MLLGWDPTTNREVWRVPSDGGNGGTMSTGGNLVFRGSGANLIAHDAETGAELWSSNVGNGTGTPVTYELDGRQYVTILSGTSPPRVWTFTLDGAR
jgi:outer membrane protein assembly factor BamB